MEPASTYRSPAGRLPPPLLPRLPAEILSYIVDLSACSEPAPSKHHLALALTSKAVHAFSERGRWRSIAIRTHVQFLSLCGHLGAYEGILQQEADLPPDQKRKANRRRRRWTPSPKTICSYIVNFLIELNYPKLSQVDSSVKNPYSPHIALQNLFVSVLHRLTHWSPHLRVMSLSSVVLSGLHRMKRDHRQFARVTEEFFDQDEDMGPYAAFREDSATSVYEAVPLLGPFGPEELTLEWDGKEDTLRSFLFSSCWCPPPGNNPRSSVEGRVGPPPVFVGLAARLARLHLIGYDPLSPFDGFSLPIETLVNSVIAGSLQATHRLVQARRLACDTWRDQARRDASQEDSVTAENAGSSLHLQSHFDGSERESAVPDQPTRIPCVTHLRYDTVKFTLRPFEALAPRLRPLFEHLHVSGASYPPRLTNSNPNQTPRTRHPYHDSAIRATLKDGSYQIPLADLAQGRELSDVAKANEAADYHLRTAFGAGSFARLHLAWDLPPPPEEGNEQLTSQMAALSVSAAESGWPTERRDVWTNYSTPSRSAAAGASKTAKSRAGPSNADSPFTMELVEAIEHRLQYPFTQQLFEARRYNTYPSKPLMQTRPPEETQRLRNDSSLWPSETERDADALGKLLGQDFLLHVGGELPLNPEYQPLLEMVPISPYAAVPDGPVQLGPDLPRGSQRNFTTVSRPRAEPILRLGGAYAAFTSDERTRLFMERIKGKAGSW